MATDSCEQPCMHEKLVEQYKASVAVYATSVAERDAMIRELLETAEALMADNQFLRARLSAANPQAEVS
jgi:hypothetical protein